MNKILINNLEPALLDINENMLHTARLSIQNVINKLKEPDSNKPIPQAMPKSLRAMESLVAKQALEIDDLKIKLADDEERIKDVMLKITCIGAPLNDNYHQYNKEQLRIFFEIQQILST